MGIFSNNFRSVMGKVIDSGVFGQRIRSRLFDSNTIDYTRNDYDLYQSLYYSSSIGGKGRDMQIGSMLAKPIINSCAGFALGNGFTCEIEGNEKATDDINDWILKNQSIILDFFIHGLRDGDSYLYVNEFGELEELDPRTVNIVLDPIRGDVIGYNVEEKYSVEDNNVKTNYVVVRQYRKDSIRYTRYLDSSDRSKGEVIYQVAFTTNGTVKIDKNTVFSDGELVHKPLPIAHFANDLEAKQVYGNSELLNVLIGMKNYHALINNATKGVINNANAIPYIKGVKNAEAIAKQSNKGETEDTDKISWSPDTILFFENVESEIGYAQAQSFMGDVGQLLEYYFMLIVEASETPEFVFGTAVQSSKASVSEQMPVVLQKATKKRSQLKLVLTDMIKIYIDRQKRLSNPTFLKIKEDAVITIVFPTITQDSVMETIEKVKYANTEGILSDETSLSMLFGDKIPDHLAELEKARADNESRATAVGAVPFEPTRIQDEVDSLTEEDDILNN